MLIKDTGLTEKEVIESRAKYGSNELGKIKQKNFLKLFLESLGDPIIRILLIALCIRTLFLLSDFDWYETVGVAISIFLASFVSTVSEYGSEAAFKKLQGEASKLKCRTYRNRRLTQILVSEVVKNDVVLLQSGEKIPADGIVISGNISVDESSLNGESEEVHKDINRNKLFRGSIVCSGECKMLVTAVGSNTIYGNIALELQDEQRDSPLKLRLRAFANTLSKIGFIAAILVGIAYLFNIVFIHNHFNMDEIKIMFETPHIIIGHVLHAITLAVTVIIVAVPEGLPMMITVVLSSNMKKMVRDNVLVRKLVGIETSGSLNILFTDKTGTLTKGKLQVYNFISGDGKQYHIDELLKKEKLFDLIKLSIWYNNGSSISEETRKAIGGNATDRALLEYIFPYQNLYFDDIKKEHIQPFDSKNKISITRIKGKHNISLVKGAPEKILSHCDMYYNEQGDIKHLISRHSFIKRMEEQSLQGIRFIAIAISQREITGKAIDNNNLILVGLIGIRDEIRAEAPRVIEEVEQAGVQVVMITGDSKDTATSIAKEVGLLKKQHLVITSDELAALSDETLKKMLPNIRVIARALPQDKSRLVRISQELNLVVGMTGDGVNDAPALKKADVGFAMGSGTEIAKEASDIVILDDNFKSISKSILYGRTTFKSIRKFIILQATINICALGLSIIGPFIGIESPITVIQMLWINLVMDTLAALAFAGEPALKEYMKEQPKKRDEPIVNSYMKEQIFFTGIYSLLLCLLFLKLPIIESIFSDHNNEIYLLTAFFALFIFVGIFNSFNARTHRLNLLSHIIKNKNFILIMALVTTIQLIIIYNGGALFRVIGLNLYELLIVTLLASTVIPIDWSRKLYLRFHKKVGGV